MKDPCNKFASILDSCVREGVVTLQRASDIQSYFSAISSGDAVLGDLAMMAHDPSVTRVLINSAYDALFKCACRKEFPRNDHRLSSIFKLASFSENAASMLSTQSYSFPDVGRNVFATFLPVLAGQLFAQNSSFLRLPPPSMLDKFHRIIQTNPIALRFFLHHIIAISRSPSFRVLFSSSLQSLQLVSQEMLSSVEPLFPSFVAFFYPSWTDSLKSDWDTFLSMRSSSSSSSSSSDSSDSWW